MYLAAGFPKGKTMSELLKMEGPLNATVAALPDSERRKKGRAKISQPVRVRPSEPHGNDFDEVRVSINVCRNGIYFPSGRDSYYKGMRVFVTFPYSDGPGAINREYIGVVVRIDKLTHHRNGIAVHLLMRINLGSQNTIR